MKHIESIEITKEIKIPGTNVILEKGDVIQVHCKAQESFNSVVSSKEFYNVINNSNKATDNVGIAIIKPYLIKLTKLYLTSCLLTKSVNIIPANAPIGVKKAPILEPMIVE